MTLSDAYGAFVMVAVVITATLSAEFMSYMLVYSTDDYKRACDRVRELNKKLVKEDEKVVSLDKRKSHGKAIERIEDELKLASQKMDGLKLKTNIIAGIGFLILYRQIAAAWTGHVVARLPFLPVSIIESLSFRGLQGNDKYNCSFTFIYTLCTMGIKANIPKALGFIAPKSKFNAARMAARQQKKEE